MLNIENRTIFCHDNIDILQNINSDCVDLIYLDPPFNKNKKFTAPIGSSAEGASFSDIFRAEDVKDEWLQTIKEDQEKTYRFLSAMRDLEGRKSSNFCYLAYMAIRLIECHRILKQTGSLYLHCDQTMSHYLKLLLDCIFGKNNFRNEIIWCYTQGGRPAKDFPKKHDVIFRVSQSENYIFNKDAIKIQYSTYSEKSVDSFTKTDEDGRIYKEVYGTGKSKKYRYYKDDGKVPYDWWIDIHQITGRKSNAKDSEYFVYPTRKPLTLLERIIKASSNEGDIVLDPFCGCATTCVAAEKLNRQWIGIDVAHKAYDLVKKRLAEEIEWSDSLFHESLINYSTSPPKRTDTGANDALQKYVYVISHKQYQGEYKVGIAKNVKARLGSYQTGDPNRDYQLEYSLHTKHFRAIEQYIHEKYDNKHEWVSGKLADIVADIEAYPNNAD